MSSLQNNPIILVKHVALSYPLSEHYNRRAVAAVPVNHLVGSSVITQEVRNFVSIETCPSLQDKQHSNEGNYSLYAYQLHTIVWVNFMLKK